MYHITLISSCIDLPANVLAYICICKGIQKQHNQRNYKFNWDNNV